MKNWHALRGEEALKAWETGRTGLTATQVEARRAEYGPNRLAAKAPPSLLHRFVEQFQDVLIFILLAAAGISVLLGEVSDAVIILAVVVINAVIGVVQEARSEQALEALKQLSAPRALVVREGATVEVDTAEVVPGDLVVVDAGRVIPCDVRWLEAAHLTVDESALTGESLAVEKSADAFVEADAPLGDRATLGFATTVATAGRGLGVAVATGMQTEVGRIARLLDAQTNEPTPLQRKLDGLGKTLGALILALCGGMFALAVLEEFLRNQSVAQSTLFELFLTSVALAVAAIPEGLVAIVTIVLALGVRLMSREKAIVRRLSAVETLGAVTMICSDKTGTLTQNKMTVVEWKSGAPAETPPKALLRSLAWCNDATPRIEGRAATGDPTEVALAEFALAHGVARDDVLAPRVDERAFDSDRKLMSTVHSWQGELWVMTKGAADRLLERCDRVLVDGREVPLTEALRQDLLAQGTAMANRALRVLGAATRPWSADADPATLETGLVFLGLVGLIDPPRLEVKPSIQACVRSGIGVTMITGDHGATALAIARELGLAEGEDQVLTGPEVDALSDEELRQRTDRVRVFARVSPENKVRIVKAFRAAGHVVSMTGDGVNDAPSLRASDIGVAMGQSGTDVAKGASDLVLADDNFATIVKAVEQGRNIYSNIRKAVFFLLSCNLGEILCIFVPLVLGLPLPLLPVHLLWVNLVTDTLPALALGMDPGDPDALKQPPRPPQESFFARGGMAFVLLNGLVKGGLTLAAFFVGWAWGGGGDAGLPLARTMAFTVLSLTQLFHAFNTRHLTKSLFTVGVFGNRWLVGAFVVCAALQSVVVLVPPLASFFKVLPLSGEQWLVVWAISASTVLFNEAAKAAVRVFGRLDPKVNTH